MKYSAEEFSLAGDQFLGRSYEDMDCQELVERMMAAVGYMRDLGGSNSWYRECLKNGWAGTPEECLKEFGVIPKGAILFICEAVSASTPAKFRDDGVGDVTHMGVKTGRGDGAIHSSSSKGCVCTSVFKDRTVKNGGWNRVGLLNVFSYVGNAGTVLQFRVRGTDKTVPGFPEDWVLRLGVQRNGGDGDGVDGDGNRGDGSAVPHSRNGQNNSTFHRLHPPLAAASETPPVPWLNEQEMPPVPQDVQEEKEGKPMKGTVTAQSGKTVKLRKEPSTNCPIYWDIPIGTELEVVDQRDKWSKCICGGLTGWMMNEFVEIGRLSDRLPNPLRDESLLSGDISEDGGLSDHGGLSDRPPYPLRSDGTPYPLRSDGTPYPLRSDDTPDPLRDSGEELNLLAEVYGILKDLCERILSVVGRG